MPYTLRGPGLRWWRNLLNIQFGGENAVRAEQPEQVEIPASVQPVLVVNSLQDNPFPTEDQRIDAQVFNPEVNGTAVPLKVQEVDPPPITIESPKSQYVMVQFNKTVNVFQATGYRTWGPFLTALWSYNAGYNLLPYGIIRKAEMHMGFETTFPVPELAHPGAAIIWGGLNLRTNFVPFIGSGQRRPVQNHKLIAMYQLGPQGSGLEYPRTNIINEDNLFIPIPMTNDRLISPPSIELGGYAITDTAGPVTNLPVKANVLIEVWSTGGSTLAPYLRNNADSYPFVDGYPVTGILYQ